MYDMCVTHPVCVCVCLCVNEEVSLSWSWQQHPHALVTHLQRLHLRWPRWWKTPARHLMERWRLHHGDGTAVLRLTAAKYGRCVSRGQSSYEFRFRPHGRITRHACHDTSRVLSHSADQIEEKVPY